MRSLRSLVVWTLAICPGPVLAQSRAPQGPIVYLIAPTASVRTEAARLLRLCRWSDTSVARDADMVMVMVRSSGSDPLAWSYDSLKWLRDAASSQLNESGAQFHVYLYRLGRDEHLGAISHRSWDADTGGVLTPLGHPPRPGYAGWSWAGCG